MLRRLDITDLSQLVLLERFVQPSPWSQEVFEKCFMVGSIGWVIEDQTTICGFIVILPQAYEAHILNLCVHPDFQRRGYGYQLLNEALTSLKNQQHYMAYLEVRRSNTKAIALYKKMGFIAIGERKNYYVDADTKEDALVFAIDLSR